MHPSTELVAHQLVGIPRRATLPSSQGSHTVLPSAVALDRQGSRTVLPSPVAPQVGFSQRATQLLGIFHLPTIYDSRRTTLSPEPQRGRRTG